MIFVFVTCPTKREAGKISMHLLKRKLVACTNIFSVDSSYWWKEKIEKHKEWLIIAKSVQNKFNRIKTEVKRLHSYEVPEIVMIEAKADDKYFKWLQSIVE